MKRDDVLGGQINLHRGTSGALNLLEYLRTSTHTNPKTANALGKPGSFIIAIQEPPVRDRRIIGLSNAHNIFYDHSSDRPRACILSSRNLNMWLVPDYTTGDMTTCIWKTMDNSLPEVFVVSVYMDITLESVWPERLEKLLRHCLVRNKEILILSDTNCHSTLWGCPDTNKRGEKLEELIFHFNLSIQNIGQHFTFFNRRAETIIDVTLASPRLNDLIEDWRVTEKVQGSDHLLIRFTLTISSTHSRKKRNLFKGDWTLFQVSLDQLLPPIPDVWSIRHLELEAKNFEAAITTALDQSHPKRKAYNNLRSFRWWNNELQELKNKVKRAFSKFRLHRSDTTHDELVTVRRNYSKALRRARRKDWQQFCNDASDPKKVSIINKIVKCRDRVSLGILQKADKTLCESPEESIDTLLDVHFPGSQLERHNFRPNWMKSRELNSAVSAFITEEKVRAAIGSFGSLKAPGPDEIQPLILSHLGSTAISYLTCLYKASLVLGYTPSCWRKGKVVFIPKPGKPDYSQPRAFRPITLSSFLVKVMERLILWELNSSTLREAPLSRNQHAFRKGKSTETALSNMIEHIERGLNKNGFALGVFLDIQGAFDNVKPDTIIKGMMDKSFSSETIQWYSHYLRNRCVEVQYQGVTKSRYLTLGTPQGGVLSPLMWNLAFEDLLKSFEDSPVNICGFADDAGLIISGKSLPLLQSRMQQAIDKAINWGQNAGLTFSPSKTVAVLFTRKYKFTYPVELQVNGTRVPYSSQVKYLGVTLDAKLSWRAHLTQKVKSAKGHLLKVKNATGKLWGFPPQMSRWLYTGIVRPALTYGAVIWASVCKKSWAKKELTRLNRLALMSMGNFRQSTPTAGLEIISHVMPLNLHIQCEAAMGYRRTMGSSLNSQFPAQGSTATGHRQYCKKFLDRIGVTELEEDWYTGEFMWNRSFAINKDSFSKGDPGDGIHIDIYTDGSRHEGLAGSGIIIIEEGLARDEMAHHLGTHASVFQCEVYAIKKAADWIKDSCQSKTVNIYVDSQAALKAISNNWVSSKLVKLTVTTLNEASQNNVICLHWIRAHVGHPGNERADELARYGSTDRSLLSTDLPAIPLSEIKTSLQSKFNELWTAEWQKRLDCRQTKQWFSTVNKSLSHSVLRTNRRIYSMLVQLITGHNFMRRHSELMDKSVSKECRLCLEEEETSFHIVAECPVLARTRLMVFGTHVLNAPLTWSTPQVLSFLREAHIEYLLDPEREEQTV